MTNSPIMMQFYHELAEYEIVATVSRQLSWSHLVDLLPINKSMLRVPLEMTYEQY